MKQYIVKRILLYFPTLALITVLVFLLMRVIPGDPAIQLLAAGGDASYTEEDLAKKRNGPGDRPPAGRAVCRLDMGNAPGRYGQGSLLPEAGKRRTQPTHSHHLRDSDPSDDYQYRAGGPAGDSSAITQDSLFDYIGRGFTIFGISVPIFVTA